MLRHCYNLVVSIHIIRKTNGLSASICIDFALDHHARAQLRALAILLQSLLPIQLVIPRILTGDHVQYGHALKVLARLRDGAPGEVSAAACLRSYKSTADNVLVIV